jgi:hypothetical protein
MPFPLPAVAVVKLPRCGYNDDTTAIAAAGGLPAVGSCVSEHIGPFSAYGPDDGIPPTGDSGSTFRGNADEPADVRIVCG